METEIQQKQAARVSEAPYCPFTATATGVTIAALSDTPGSGSQWEVVYTGLSDELSGRIAYEALQCLRDSLGYDDVVVSNMNHCIVTAQCAKIIGLQIREKLQLLAADAMRYCITSGIRFDIPPVLWSHPNFTTPIWCDPYDIVVPSDQRQWVKYEQLANYLNIPYSGVMLSRSPVAQVEFAGALVRAANL